LQHRRNTKTTIIAMLLHRCLSSITALIYFLSWCSAFQTNHGVKEARLNYGKSATRLWMGDGVSTKKDLKTFQRYLEIETWRNSEFRDLEPVLRSVAESCKQINRIVQRAQTDDLYGIALGTDGKPLDDNVQGEVQQQLDVLCNTIMLRAFCGGGSSSIHSVASEEEDEPRCCSDVMTDSAFAVGDYIAVFDPIDGSKNIDSSLPVGTIFAIYKVRQKMIGEQIILHADSPQMSNLWITFSTTN